MTEKFHNNPSRCAGFQRPGLTLLIVALVLAGWGIHSRRGAQAALRADTEAAAAISVATIKPSSAQAGDDLVLPGNVEAWMEAPIYARTNGYLKRWTADIGASVKAGEVLAEIETPEVDEQLRQAEAEAASAEADAALAQSTADRWKDLLATDSVSKQEADEKTGAATARNAALRSARANLARLRELRSFQKIVAPFDGVITARDTDVGALITAGSGGGGQALFHIAAMKKLRVYVQVPQAYASSIRPGMEAALAFSDHAGQQVPARVAGTANALDGGTRTLRAQLEVDNSKGELIPGGYAEVHFKLPVRGDSLRLPANTLLFRAEGLQVATLDAQNQVRLKTVTLGRDFGATVEVAQGLGAGDTVVVNPPDSVTEGQVLHPVAPAPAASGGAPR